MIWGNNSFSVFDCKNGHKSFHYVYPGLFAELDIKSWHLFPHPMNDLVLHVKWGRSANVAILTLGPWNFHSVSEPTTRTSWRMRDHLDQIWAIPAIPDAASDMRGQPWSAEPHTHPPATYRCQRSPAEQEKGSAWAHTRLSAHTGVTEINGCCSKALSLGVVCCTTEGDWYIYSVNNYKR